MTQQRGNILFLILLAVVLFAALAYAVTSSMRGGGNDASKESAQAAAAEILNYATLLEQTIGRLRLVNNCKLSEISFENSVVSGYTNTTAPRVDKSCNVFDANGGGIAWKTPNLKWLEDQSSTNAYQYGGVQYGAFNFPNTVCIRNLSAATCNTSLATENVLLVGLKYLSKNVCDAINVQFGANTNTSAVAFSPAGEDLNYYKGSFYTGNYNNIIQSGRRSGCAYSSRSGYTFWHVLETQ